MTSLRSAWSLGSWQELAEDFRRTDMIFARLRDESFPEDVLLISDYVKWFIDVGRLLAAARIRLVQKIQFGEIVKLLATAKESIYEAAMNQAAIAVEDRLGCAGWFTALQKAAVVRSLAQQQAMVVWLAVKEQSTIPGANWDEFQAAREHAQSTYSSTVTSLGASWLGRPTGS